MCDIWKELPKKDFQLLQFKKILQDPVFRKTKNISLTGGEPFMVKNLFEYYSYCKSNFPKANFCIGTNGFYTHEILGFLKIVDKKQFSLAVSFDGIKSHNSIRGNNQSKKRVINTIKMIKTNFPEIKITLKFTINHQNYDELFPTAKIAHDLSIPFEIKLLETLSCHQTRIKSKKIMLLTSKMRESIINQFKKILSLGYASNTTFLKQFIKKSKEDIKTCNWPKNKIFIGLDGSVFICRKMDPIGNVFRSSLGDIWCSSGRKNLIQKMNECDDLECLSFIPE